MTFGARSLFVVWILKKPKYCPKKIVEDAEQEKIELEGDIVQFSLASLKLGDDGSSW